MHKYATENRITKFYSRDPLTQWTQNIASERDRLDEVENQSRLSGHCWWLIAADVLAAGVFAWLVIATWRAHS